MPLLSAVVICIVTIRGGLLKRSVLDQLKSLLFPALLILVFDCAHGQGKPDALLAAAMKNMTSGVWSVNGSVTSKKTIKLHGLLSGEDFDLTMEPGVKPNTPMREIVIKDKAWVCSDGETWHAGSANDRLIYNWTHVPIMAGRQLPAFEKIGVEQRNGQTWLHVRLKVPEKKSQSQGITAVLARARFARASSIHRTHGDADVFAG